MYGVRVVDYNTNSAIVTLKEVVPVDIETIGLNIRKCRNAKKMRQEDLAQKANVSSNYISAVERGVKIPSVERIERPSMMYLISWLEICPNNFKVRLCAELFLMRA